MRAPRARARLRPSATHRAAVLRVHQDADALRLAASNGHTATVTELVSLGADPNAMNLVCPAAGGTHRRTRTLALARSACAGRMDSAHGGSHRPHRHSHRARAATRGHHRAEQRACARACRTLSRLAPPIVVKLRPAPGLSQHGWDALAVAVMYKCFPTAAELVRLGAEVHDDPDEVRVPAQQWSRFCVRILPHCTSAARDASITTLRPAVPGQEHHSRHCSVDQAR